MCHLALLLYDVFDIFIIVDVKIILDLLAMNGIIYNMLLSSLKLVKEVENLKDHKFKMSQMLSCEMIILAFIVFTRQVFSGWGIAITYICPCVTRSAKVLISNVISCQS